MNLTFWGVNRLPGKKVLLIVEGEKAEKELFTRFYHLYRIDTVEIVAYKTHIYAFYNRLKNDYGDKNGCIDYDNIDLPLFMNDYLGLREEELLNESDFSDIILIFDFDPQDPQFDPNILTELIEHYNESTDKGKLYINYPMLESFQDMETIYDRTFETSTVDLATLTTKIGKTNKYKKHVEERSFLNRIDDIDKTIGNGLIKLHYHKTNYLLQQMNGDFDDKNPDLQKICMIQCDKLRNEQLIWILNTSLLHLYIEYGYIAE